MAAVRWSPPVQTVAFVGAVGVLYAVLGTADGGSDVAASLEWRLWKSVAAVGIAAAGVLGGHGLRRMRSEARALGLSIGELALQVLLALGLFGAAMVFINVQPEGARDLPIAHLWSRLRFVELTTGLAVIPWLVLVWTTHSRLRHIGSGTGGAPSRQGLQRLAYCWDLISDCVFAFIALVAIALVDTGALQATWAAHIEATGAPDDFTESLVLVYALYFSVLLASITLPLLAAYRKRARELVDAVYELPADAELSAEWVSSRGRLEAFTHINVGILRNPLTAFSLLTPLITAALALVLPQLRGG